jgi:hypothetical protein
MRIVKKTKKSWMAKLGIGVVIAAAAIAGAPSDADAFCGFYVSPGEKPLFNDASFVALMRDGTRTVMSMSNNYKGPPSDFAMVVPVPVVLQKENVKTLPKNVFTHLEELSAPRLVEYWEQDPCPKFYPGDMAGGGMAPPKTAAKPMAAGDTKKKDYGVKIEAQFTVGEYEIVVLSAKESDGLESWLHDNKYNIPSGASAALAPYIKEQQKFFVAKVDIKKVQLDKQGVAQLSPLRFSFESPDFRLPVRLGLLNAQQKQDLIIFTLSRSLRYDVANYPNVFIPTNLEVKNDVRDKFAPFYASLFDEAVSKGNGKGIVTEYSWMSSSCDPCPTPPLNDSDIATLGGDVLFGMGAPPDDGGAPGGPAGGPMKKKAMPFPGGGYYGGGMQMVLTRLHARYDATSLSDDIVFRGAEAVVGGREFVVDDKGTLEKGAVSSTQNNFQARYIIRHPWTGPITCANPQRGIWGGPPAGVQGSMQPKPATGLAQVARGSVAWSKEVLKQSAEPEFKVVAASDMTPTMSTIAPPTDDAGPGDALTPGGDDASVGPSGATVPSVQPGPHAGGCGCEVPGALHGTGTDFIALGAAGTIFALGRLASRKRGGKGTKA